MSIFGQKEGETVFRASLRAAWHASCQWVELMKRSYQSLPARTKWELILSVSLVAGILVALVTPGPARNAERPSALFQLALEDYLQPLYGSPRVVRNLNARAAGLAEFGGYDEFPACQRIADAITLANAVRFAGQTLSLAGVEFIMRERTNATGFRVFISEDFWERALARDPSVLGGNLNMNGRQYRVAGITRRARAFCQETDLWIPVSSRDTGMESSSFRIVGGLRAENNSSANRKALLRKCLAANVAPESPNPGSLRILPIEGRVYFGEPKAPFVAGPADVVFAAFNRAG